MKFSLQARAGTEGRGGMKSTMVAVVVALAMAASTARAWDSEGHMMVAAVAWKHLDDPSRARVAQLLKLNPDYSKWIANIAPDQQAQIAFVTAATWPDAIKAEAGYIFDGERPSGPAAVSYTHLDVYKRQTLRIEDGQNNNKMDAFVDTAGDFLRAAAGIFAPPDKGDRNLPSESATTLRDLRKAAVKVTLLLDVNPRGSGSAKDSKAMEDALQRLRECVERFVESVEKEEARPIDQIS